MTSIRKSRKGKFILIAVILVPILLATTAFAAYWWQNRPFNAVQLTPPEQIKLEQKLAVMDENTPEEGPAYEKGDKKIEFTERELNALLESNMQAGDALKIDLRDDAFHLRINTELPDDLPLAGGKKLKGQARFFVSQEGEQPTLVMDDFTIWGISLPNAWLGELKGKNLLGELFPGGKGISGVKSFTIESGKLTLELEE